MKTFRPSVAVGRGGALLAALGLLAWAFACCGDDTETEPQPDPLEITEGCNPIAADRDCLLPYPSDFFRVDGAGGPKVAFPKVALPLFGGSPVDMTLLHPPDGFSVGSPILAMLGEPIDGTKLPTWAMDPSASTTAASPTLIVDTETGVLVEHFAEVDAASADPARAALILRPLVRLEPGRRYVVALQHLVGASGAEIAPPRGFESLVTDGGSAHPALSALSPHYEDAIFPVLEAAGVARAELQLAWDFTTRTDADAMGDMLSIRAEVMQRVAAGDIDVTVESEEDDPSEHIAKRLELSIEVPLYVSSVEPGATLTASPPVANGTARVPFTVWIPKSVENRAPTDPPARLLQYGHGFFGNRTEADGFPSELADTYGFVIVAADWWGISSEDKSTVAGALLTDPEHVLDFTDRVHQAMANVMTIAAAREAIAALPELDVGGTPAFDPSAIYFYGISFGHILGGTYAALSPDIDRVALGSGGANIGLMMFRARAFLPLLALLQTQMSDPLDQQKFAAMAQSVFERIDPMTYAAALVSKPLPGGPSSRKVLMQMGIGDAQVPNLGTYFDARIVGAPLLTGASEPFPPWLPTTAAPSEGSALTAFDFGVDVTIPSIPQEDNNDIHDELRLVPASQKQVSDFLRPDGAIDNPCRGVCDPE